MGREEASFERKSPRPYCCSTVEQLYWARGGGRVARTQRAEGWKVSEVVELVGLSRRDIQRACYEGKGGVGILSPQDSSWGRRTYSIDDLARLFLTSELRREGKSLPEVKEAFDAEQAAGRDSRAMLGRVEQRLSELEETVTGRLLKARALRLAMEGAGQGGLAGLVGERIVQRAARLFPDGCVGFGRELLACMEELGSLRLAGEHCAAGCVRACVLRCARLLACDCGMGSRGLVELVDDIVGEPGTDAAVELWLGAGSLSFIRDAWEAWCDGCGIQESEDI